MVVKLESNLDKPLRGSIKTAYVVKWLLLNFDTLHYFIIDKAFKPKIKLRLNGEPQFSSN